METSKLICWFLYDGNLAFDEVRLLFSCDDLEPQTFMMEHLRKYLTVFSYFYRKMLDRILLYTTLEWVFIIFGGKKKKKTLWPRYLDGVQLPQE